MTKSKEVTLNEDTMMSDDVSLYLTESAVNKVFALMEEEENLALKLRVYITGGGCSGFQYGFAFEEKVKADDEVLKQAVPEHQGKNVTLLVDPLSYQYLSDATIDYREDANGSQFVIRNPNAKTTCGCGSSFSI